MGRVDAAEQEASEVLHSMLSVERVEKQEDILDETDDVKVFEAPASVGSGADSADNDTTQIQWHTPVAISAHSLFGTLENNAQFEQTIDDQVVVWDGQATVPDQLSPNDRVVVNTDDIDEEYDEDDEFLDERPKKRPKPITTKRIVKKRKEKNTGGPNETPTQLEECSSQVKERFKRGCECQDESCFRGLNADNVYKHRLNIAELTKGEHDMYLMGVTMACLANPDTTVRQKERRRLRAQYVYQGRRVCLDAFLYLENCTHYQLKRIRKHVITHGVAPRVHGNHGKKPHNTFSLDIYKHATEFLKQYLEQQSVESGASANNTNIQLPWDITRKSLHDAYREYGQILEPGIKLMGYSTFRHFMKVQFPHVKFCKLEAKTSAQQQQQQQQQQQHASSVQTDAIRDQPQTVHIISDAQTHLEPDDEDDEEEEDDEPQCMMETDTVQQVIPLVVAQNADGTASAQHQAQTFIVTPVPQLLQNGSITAAQGPNGSFSYQLTNTGYVINEQGNIVTTVASATAQHGPYTFNRI